MDAYKKAYKKSRILSCSPYKILKLVKRWFNVCLLVAVTFVSFLVEMNEGVFHFEQNLGAICVIELANGPVLAIWYAYKQE